MSVRRAAILAALVGGVLLAWPLFAQDGPLTAALNLRVRADSNGYLMVSAGATSGSQGPLTSFGNIRLRTDANGYLIVNCNGCATSSGAAPADATYLTQTSSTGLSAEQALASLSSGIMRVATTTGVVTSLTDSAGIFTNISDETGSGVIVGSTAPSLTRPVLAGSAPAVADVGANSCGTTAATIAGNDNVGSVTVGATSGTQCRVTFTTAAPTRRHCVTTNTTTTANLVSAVPVSTTVTDLIGVFGGGDVLDYVCFVR